MLSRTGTLARVRWNDDGVVEENVRLGGENLLAVVGTRRHQFLMDLPSLIERFTADPVTVVLDLLRESPRGLKAPAIKELLVELGLDPAIVDRTWRSVQARLSRHDDVYIKANTYRWKRPVRSRDGLGDSTDGVPPVPAAPESETKTGTETGTEGGAAGSPAHGTASGTSRTATASAVPETISGTPGAASGASTPGDPVPVPGDREGDRALSEATPELSTAANASAPTVTEAADGTDAPRSSEPAREDDPVGQEPEQRSGRSRVLKSDAKADLKPDAKADPKPDTKTGAKTSPKTDAKTGPEADGETVRKPGRKSDQKADRKAARKADSQGEEETAGPVETAEERARALAERCERLEQDLRTAADRAIGLRTVQERQLRLDGARVLADLAAEIEEMVTGGATPEVVVGRVRDLVAAQALRPVGKVGEETAFDPAEHEPLTGAPEPGTSVRVVRPGYRWATLEGILLHRALVERSGT
ncbi:hypothetical protein GCM10017559_39740 [Streptosporangium longisporum]|uniref:Nucleotide exchange factor GrpE n=1 Tax=Streptosporangium longisporum TaxID=46187 RepID=A0ABP6KIU0_9ACTN